MNNIHEIIDNELMEPPYQSMSNRSKRCCKRNIIKLFNMLINNEQHITNDNINNQIILNDYYHIKKIVCLVQSYFIVLSIIFTYLFFLKFF